MHNETATGVTTRIPHARKAIDKAKHPALLMVDNVPSLPPSTNATTSGAWTSQSRIRKRA